MKVNPKEQLKDLIDDLEIWAMDILENEFPDAEEIYEEFGAKNGGDLLRERIIKTQGVGDSIIFDERL
jgi:hypothetical protein